MNSRNTKQKQIILETIKENRSHPTPQELIELVRKKDSNIGQATIYRNIKKLKEEEKIIELETYDGNHLDYNRGDHYHIYCKNCKKVIDVFNLESLDSLIEYLKKENIDIIIDDVILTGICKNCRGENHEEVSL